MASIVLVIRWKECSGLSDWEVILASRQTIIRNSAGMRNSRTGKNAQVANGHSQNLAW